MKKYVKCGYGKPAEDRDEKVKFIIDTLNYLSQYGSGVGHHEEDVDKVVDKMNTLAEKIDSMLRAK